MLLVPFDITIDRLTTIKSCCIIYFNLHIVYPSNYRVFMKQEKAPTKTRSVAVRIATRVYDPEPSIQGTIAIQLWVALALEAIFQNEPKPPPIDDSHE